MLERPKTFPALPTFADDKYYRIQLWRSAQYAGRTFTPKAKQVMRGDVAKKIAECIYTAEAAVGSNLI